MGGFTEAQINTMTGAAIRNELTALKVPTREYRQLKVPALKKLFKKKLGITPTVTLTIKFVYMGGNQRVPRNVTHVRVHESVKIITARAFEYCENLVSVKMHDGVEIIEESAFHVCTFLREIKLAGVRVIETKAFCYCTRLVGVEFGDKLESIGFDAFASTSLRSIKLPAVRIIGIGAFSACYVLTDVELSEDLDTIKGGAFRDCRRLRRITLPLKDNLLLGDNVFNGCEDLSKVDLVGGIHKTISSLLLESWRDDMKDEIDRINQDLPSTRFNDKTAAIRRWMGRVIRRIEHYKSKRASDDGVMDDATMDNPSFDQLQKLKQQDDPKEQVSVHNDSMSSREEDETDKSASSAGAGSNLEDEIPEAEIDGMAVEIKDDNSFGGGDQNSDFHTESDVSSEEERQSNLAQSTKGSDGESEIQRLKDQLKETQKRLKEREEENGRLKGEKKETQKRLKEREEENGRLEGENVRLNRYSLGLNKKLKVSVQTSVDLVGAAFKEMKVVHEPKVIRQLAEEGLLECLRNHKVELGQSKIEGARFGAFAVAKISKGERIFHFNGAPSNETISLTEDKIATLPPHVQRVVRMYTIPDDDGLRDVPKNGFSFALGISWFLNTAYGTNFEANVEVGPKLDESGFAELIAMRDIEKGEELLDSYVLGDTL